MPWAFGNTKARGREPVRPPNTIDVIVSKPNYAWTFMVPRPTFTPSLVAMPLKGACQLAKNLKI